MTATRTQLFGRALRLSCPNCGHRPVVKHWLVIADDCPACRISLVRGNRVGAYIVNMAFSESVVMIAVLSILISGWPTPPWDLLGWLAPLLAVLSPLAFYPFARLIFVAADLAIHPDLHRDEDP